MGAMGGAGRQKEKSAKKRDQQSDLKPEPKQEEKIQDQQPQQPQQPSEDQKKAAEDKKK